MRKRKNTARRETGTSFLQAIRASLLACILTTVLVLLLAFMLKWDWLSPGAMHTATTIIKAASACFAGWLTAKYVADKAWVFSGLAGLLYMLLSYVVFSLLEQNFALSVLFVSDMILGLVCGMLSGIILGLLKSMRAQA